MLKFQRERLGDILPEIEQLLRNKCKEDGEIFSFDMPRLLDYDDCGYRRQYTARFNGRIVGHSAVYVSVSSRTNIKTAYDESWYLLPDFRKGWNAVKLYKFVEKDLKNEGVKSIRLTLECGSRISSALDMLNFKVLSVNYEKEL